VTRCVVHHNIVHAGWPRVGIRVHNSQAAPQLKKVLCQVREPGAGCLTVKSVYLSLGRALQPSFLAMRYEESTQANKWQLSSQIELNSLREHANKRARVALSAIGDGDVKMEDRTNERIAVAVVDGDVNSQNNLGSIRRVFSLSKTRGDRPTSSAIGYEEFDDDCQQQLMDEFDPNYGPTNTSIVRGNHPFLSPADEAALISFYCSKIPLLIGPHALLPRCRRDAKVAATACLLFRRFYLSNSVMMHDPKSMLAAAAFLASKVEDCMILVGYLEMGTKEMDAPVPLDEILDAEISLIEGIDFDLLVFSPYKTVLSYTEDLRTFLKTERGMRLITFPDQDGVDIRRQQLVGEDLRPILDIAMKICDDVIVSDVPLMFAPGEVGLAALMIANEYVSANGQDEKSTNVDGNKGERSQCPRIDIMGYVQSRFSEVNIDVAAIDAVARRVAKLGQLIRELKEGKLGCGNYGLDLEKLKEINKKLKKCRAWGVSEKKSGTKRKKRKLDA
jgi:cyclin H